MVVGGLSCIICCPPRTESAGGVSALRLRVPPAVVLLPLRLRRPGPGGRVLPGRGGRGGRGVSREGVVGHPACRKERSGGSRI